MFSVCQIYKVWKQFTTIFLSVLFLFVLFSVCQIYKVWKQFTTTFTSYSFTRSCFQYVKFIKFESNSQHARVSATHWFCCFQYVKFIKFESNSQLRNHNAQFDRCCFQYVKFIKFESNSQQKEDVVRKVTVVLHNRIPARRGCASRRHQSGQGQSHPPLSVRERRQHVLAPPPCLCLFPCRARPHRGLWRHPHDDRREDVRYGLRGGIAENGHCIVRLIIGIAGIARSNVIVGKRHHSGHCGGLDGIRQQPYPIFSRKLRRLLAAPAGIRVESLAVIESLEGCKIRFLNK